MAEKPNRTGREIIGRWLRRGFVALILSAAVIYAADYLVLRLRIATGRQPYGTVKVRPYYAVPRKDKKTEFYFDEPQDETCVQSLLPHLGNSPCWYLSRNREKRIDL